MLSKQYESFNSPQVNNMRLVNVFLFLALSQKSLSFRDDEPTAPEQVSPSMRTFGVGVVFPSLPVLYVGFVA